MPIRISNWPRRPDMFLWDSLTKTGPRRGLRPFWQRHQLRQSFRPYSSRTEQTATQANAKSRAERILARMPSLMGRYTRRLQDAPVSHAVAFLILHEITAIVPLFGLFGLFHYTNYVPIDYMMGHYGNQVVEGVQRFERYFRRKGWFGFGAEEVVEEKVDEKDGVADETDNAAVLQRWTSTDTKYKIVVEVALAYAITKALLPVRIVVSVSATPWFAGILARLRGRR